MTIATLTQHQVAALLGWSEIHFARKVKHLVESCGFPARLPGGNYYALAIDVWMARMSGMEIPDADVLAAQRAALASHYQERTAA